MDFDWDKIKESMTKGVVLVTFRKEGGQVREMECTLAEYLLPETTGSGSTHRGDETIICFDIEKQAWRSFRKDRVIDVEVL
jgi:hypothetical protein